MYNRIYNLLLEASNQEYLKSKIKKRLGKKPKDTVPDDIHNKEYEKRDSPQKEISYDSSRQETGNDGKDIKFVSTPRNKKDRKQKAKEVFNKYHPQKFRTRKPSVKSQKKTTRRDDSHVEALRRLGYFPEK